METEKKEREQNATKFISVESKGQVEVSDILNAISTPSYSPNLKIREVLQKNLRANLKWSQFFEENTTEINYDFDKFVKLSNFYEISKGNTKWHIEQNSGTGADSFFFLSKDTADEHLIPSSYLFPAISRSRDVSGFEFTESDWKRLHFQGKRTFLFKCSLPRDSIENGGLNYIHWGETECRVSEKRGKGNLCSQTSACSRRKTLSSEYFGWYDLGNIRNPKIISVYQAWRKTRFVLNKYEVAMYHGLLAFYEKDGVRLTDVETRSVLAYLNSSFAQYYVEINGRKTGAGAIALEVQTALDMPVLDVRNISDDSKEILSALFEKLVSKTREIGGAKDEGQMIEVSKVVYEIDEVISKLVGLERDTTFFLQKKVEELIGRRMRDAKAPDQNLLRGEHTTMIKRPERKRPIKISSNKNLRKLSEFSENLDENKEQ